MQRGSVGFTLVEVTVAIAILGIVGAMAGAGAWNARMLDQRVAVKAVAQALDRAQLDYLSRHPGGSLRDVNARAEIQAAVEASLRLHDEREMSSRLRTLHQAVQYDVTVRPATCQLNDIVVTFPKVRSLHARN